MEQKAPMSTHRPPLRFLWLALLFGLLLHLTLQTGCTPVYEQISSYVDSGTLRVTVDYNKLFEPAKIEALDIKVTIQSTERALKGHVEFRRASLFYNPDPNATTSEYSDSTELIVPNLRLPLSFEQCGAASFSGSRKCDTSKQKCDCVFDSGQKRTLKMEVVSSIRGLSNQDWRRICDNSKSANLVVFVGFQSPTIEPGSNTGALDNFWSAFVRETDNLQSSPARQFKLDCVELKKP